VVSRSANHTEALKAAVLGPAGRSQGELRRAVLESAAWLAGHDETPRAGAVPQPLAGLVEKIVRHAYRVTDQDIAAAQAAGYREDELFDVIVAASLGAGLVRHERGLAAIEAWERSR
jgi:hypothetical protein